jgi:uncharacterized protein (TIGR02145 family)
MMVSLTKAIGNDSIYVYKNGSVNNRFSIFQVDSLSMSNQLDSLKFTKNNALISKMPVSAIDSISFVPPLPAGTIRDIDGNIYTSVKIGTQTWLVQNLRTTRYRNGDAIPNLSNNGAWITTNTGAYSMYDNDPENGAVYGYLYNWHAVNDRRNIAPAGWHIPSQEEWLTLENYLSANGFNFDGTKTGNKFAKSLASRTLWKGSNMPGGPGNNMSVNNSTNFTGLPGGGRYGNSGVFFSKSEAAFWWTRDESTTVEAYYRGLFYGYSFFSNFVSSKNLGFGIRCIKSDLATVTTNAIDSVTTHSATGGGVVTADGQDEVTHSGVCWNTTGSPTIYDNATVNGSGVGDFKSKITNLKPGTTYYLRAYASNSVGTAYGNELSFTTIAVAPTVTTDSVTGIRSSVAKSGGKIVTDGGAAITAKGVCWSTSENPTVADMLTNDGSGSGDFTSSITGLQPATVYYVRAYATNEKGTTYGIQRMFKTLDIPTVTTVGVTEITDSTAVAGGTIVSTGGAEITTKGICWSTSGNPSTSDSVLVVTDEIDSFTVNLTNLSPATTYYVRAYATNSEGTAYGDVVSFTTLASLPTVTTAAITAVTDSTATGGGEVVSDGGAEVTARGICWSTTAAPTIIDNTNVTTDGTGTGVFISALTGLLPETTYYVRAYSVNSIGIAYGQEIIVVTPPKTNTIE